MGKTIGETLEGTFLSLKAIWDRVISLERKIENLIAGHGALATEANATANKNEIIAAIPTEEQMKVLYAARAEKNTDGDNTYTIVLPYTAQVIETEKGYEINI